MKGARKPRYRLLIGISGVASPDCSLETQAKFFTAKKFMTMKRSIVIDGHKTSVSIEEPFWRSLRDIAAARGVRVSELVASIDSHRQQGNLSSHIRLFVLDHYQTLAERSQAVDQSASSSTGVTPP
jgi:predicted DNA-binding ribbon-helix-helix protein